MIKTDDKSIDFRQYGTGECINITSDYPYWYELRVDGRYYGHNTKIRYWNLTAKINLASLIWTEKN